MEDYPAERALCDFYDLIRDGGRVGDRAPGPLKTGVDLGTATIVLSVLDSRNRPVAGALTRSTVVRDGIVVDYVGAVAAVRRMKAELEERLGEPLETAATAIPPGILPGNTRAIANVVEAAGFTLAEVSDEPTAAARLLGVRDGAVVDVGGGTTGISVLKDGAVLFTDDEATGGTHMTLVLAGALGLPFEEAERLKTDASREDEVFPVVRPVVEKMAAIVNHCLDGRDVGILHVVGGACGFSRFEEVFRKETGRTVSKPVHPMLVTPLGIAMFGAGGEP